VKINYVGKKVNEVTDAYVERYFSSIAHTVADLREYARTELQKNAEANAERKAYNAVLETAMANAEYVSINQDDVDYFYNMTTATIRQYASLYGQSEETVYSSLYQNAYGTYQEFVQQAKDHALTSTKQYMLLQAIAKAENITVTDEEYKTAVEGYMAESSITDFTQFETTYGKDYLSYLALCDKTLKFLHESAVITKEE
jgi:trigger factor